MISYLNANKNFRNWKTRIDVYIYDYSLRIKLVDLSKVIMVIISHFH